MKISRLVLVIVSVLVVISAFVAGWYSNAYFNPSQRIDVVTLELNWLVGWNKAVYFVGVDQGLYAKYGISVNIVPGTGSKGVVLDLDKKKTQFGEPAMDTVMSLVAGGSNVTAFGVIWPLNTMCTIYIEGRGIQEPADLAGKVCVGAPGSSVVTLWPAFAQAVGIDPNNITMIMATAAAQPAYLVEGRCDFLISTVGQFMTVESLANSKGLKVGAMFWEDYGINFVGTSLACHPDLIKENPDLVRRFALATYEAYEWNILNPNATAAILARYEPTLNVTDGEFYLTEMVRIHKQLYEGRTGLQYGWIDPNAVENLVRVVAVGLNITNPPAPTDLYTNEFVKAPPTT